MSNSSTNNTPQWSESPILYVDQTPPSILDMAVPRGGIVFDVGANNGNKAADFRNRGARVVCFEPQPQCAAQLRKRFSGDYELTVVERGLAEKPGSMDLFICENADTLSTFAEHWKSGRFAEYSWNKRVSVGVSTLDEMIQIFGTPDYCKIDVEGFEYQVLRGLSRMIPLLSFEFTYEFVDNAQLCMEYLSKLGYREFNLAIEEGATFHFSDWKDSASILAFIKSSPDKTLWGDIYARWTPAKQAQAGNAPDDWKEMQAKGLIHPGQPVRLHLGCGESLFQGYINIDYSVSEHAVMKVRPDYCANLTKMMLPNESVDEVRSHHVFEHFSRVTALFMLIRWHQWLKVGGTLCIETPDLVGCAERLVAPGTPWNVKMGLVRHLTGDQTAAWAYHVDQWFPERYERTLPYFGFAAPRIERRTWDREPYLANVTVYATKQRSMTLDELKSAAHTLLRESLVDPIETWNQEVWEQQLGLLLSGQGECKPGNVTDTPITPRT